MKKSQYIQVKQGNTRFNPDDTVIAHMSALNLYPPALAVSLIYDSADILHDANLVISTFDNGEYLTYCRTESHHNMCMKVHEST